MIAFVAAMEKEVAPILEKYGIEQSKLGYASLHTCKAGDTYFYVLISGIGKVFAGMAVAALLESHGKEITGVINLGVGGTLVPEKAPLDSLILGTVYTQHDMDTTPLGDPYGYISGIGVIEFKADQTLCNVIEKKAGDLGYPVTKGQICSGDQFIVTKKQKDAILSLFPNTISVDMESAAFAQACYAYGCPFFAGRFVSDTGHDGEYEAHLPICRDRIFALVEALLSLLA